MKSSKLIELSPPNVNLEITGRMVSLTPVTSREINEQYASWLNSPETNQFLEVRYKSQSLEDIQNYINGIRLKPGCEIFAVFDKARNLHVGNIAIIHFNEGNQGTGIYGILIGDPKAQLAGLGAEATLLLLEYLFQLPEIRRVQAGVIAANVKSWQTLESIGFKREGTFRKASVLSSGEFSDNYVYAVLKEEWGEKRLQFSSLIKNIRISNLVSL